MAYNTARATESAGMAIFLYRSFTNAAEDGSEVPCFSSDSTAPGEMIVHRRLATGAEDERGESEAAISGAVEEPHAGIGTHATLRRRFLVFRRQPIWVRE